MLRKKLLQWLLNRINKTYKKKMMLLYSSLMMLLMFSISCGSLLYARSNTHVLSKRVKTVYVKPFINNTNKFGLETKFMDTVIDEILMDGRLSLVDTESNADYIFIVVIKQYILQTINYDDSYDNSDDDSDTESNIISKRYILRIKVNVSFVNRGNNINLFTEPNVEEMYIYTDITKEQKDIIYKNIAIIEKEAENIIWSKMSKNIVRQAIKAS